MCSISVITRAADMFLKAKLRTACCNESGLCFL